MSIALITKVWESELPSSTHKLVLLAFADFANDQGLCWPSVGRVAWKSGLSRRQVQRILADLKKLGVLVVRSMESGQATPLYELRGDNLTPLTENRGDIHVTPRGDTMTPKPSVTRTSYPVTRKPRNRLTSSSEPSNNSENNFFENRYKNGKRQS